MTLAIEPMPSPRPRVGRNGVYMPTAYVRWKNLLVTLLRRSGAIPKTLFQGPLTVTLGFHCQAPGYLIPKRSKRTQKPLMPKRPTGLLCGDLDNFSKSVLDAMNQVVYTDDKQVYDLLLTKAYALPYGSPGRITICVKENTSPVGQENVSHGIHGV